jgi:hypothetical protein
VQYIALHHIGCLRETARANDAHFALRGAAEPTATDDEGGKRQGPGAGPNPAGELRILLSGLRRSREEHVSRIVSKTRSEVAKLLVLHPLGGGGAAARTGDGVFWELAHLASSGGLAAGGPPCWPVADRFAAGSSQRPRRPSGP